MGAVKSTVQNVEIIRVDAERQLLLIRGALPGSRGGGVTVKPAIRAQRAAVAQAPKAAAAAPGKPAAKPAAAPKPAAKK
jgi:large subunit ribosomal protein L3